MKKFSIYFNIFVREKFLLAFSIQVIYFRVNRCLILFFRFLDWMSQRLTWLAFIILIWIIVSGSILHLLRNDISLFMLNFNYKWKFSIAVSILISELSALLSVISEFFDCLVQIQLLNAAVFQHSIIYELLYFLFV